ncbi:MAG TPA: NAD(P)-binding protein [Candidatus Nanoarchaeia archaeon]|nr:NAD(P)-binding protein [Candidatus Nanoarchaeia archaeon]
MDKGFYVSREVKILAVMFLSVFVLGTVGYALAYKVSFVDGLVLTFDTLTYTEERGHGIVRVIQVLLHIFGVVIVWVALWTSFDLMIQGQFSKYFSGVRMMDKIKNLKDHYIVCGGGRVGEHVAELLIKSKKKFVIIERQTNVDSALTKKGCLIVSGDALDENVLLEAGIKRAKVLISVLPETEKNILVTLSAKELNPDIKIYSRADKKEYVKKLHKAGADFVSLPESSCAEEIMAKIE